MLAVPIEENLARKYEESFYDENLRKILHCLELADKLGEDSKMMQVRITAFVNSDLLESLKQRKKLKIFEFLPQTKKITLSKLEVNAENVRTFHRALIRGPKA